MLGGLLAAGGSLLGGLFGSSSAKKAAKAQADAMNRATDLQRDMFNQTRSDLLPWMKTGGDALSMYAKELGITDGLGFQETPGYQFAVSEGQKGVTNNLSALGMKNSGAALKALDTYSQGMANQEYGNWLDRIAGVSGQGQQAAGQIGQFGANAANGMANTIVGAGNARASGYVGANNAWTNALEGLGGIIGKNSNSLNMFPAAPRSSGGLY